MEWKYDCRHYVGHKPCVFKRLCEGCPQYDPMGKRLLIVKLGAMGDVLRTTSILRPLRERYGACHLTWVVAANTVPLLRPNPLIDRVLPAGPETTDRLSVERFDVAICLDKESAATTLAMRALAAEKLGFGMRPEGGVFALNRESEYALRLGLDDELKFRTNRKTYQQITFEQLSLTWDSSKGDYQYALTEGEAAHAEAFRGRLPKGSGPVIGLNTGAGAVFANKAWTLDGYIALAKRLVRDLSARLVLLGGPDEVARNAEIALRAGVPFTDAGTDNPLRTFAAKLAVCDLVVTGDSLAMHIAIALKRRVVVLFGSTSPVEVELYGRGEKVITPIDCHPCYRTSCDIHPSCQETITDGMVFDAIGATLAKPAPPAPVGFPTPVGA